MEDQPRVNNDQGEQKDSGISRRKFIGALGVAAAAGAFLERSGGEAAAQNPPTLYYQDAFGNVVPIDPAVVASGFPLPPLVSQPSPDATSHKPKRKGHHAPTADIGVSCPPAYIACGYTQPNILLIMVDQWRSPRWLCTTPGSNPSNPSGTTSQLDYVNSQVTPNVWGLQQTSYDFYNYFVAAAKCSPSRSTLLTGLYSQQTCMFKTIGPGDPTLRPFVPGNPCGTGGVSPTMSDGFPTIGNVLSQPMIQECVELGDPPSYSSYDTAWVGKWHVSCAGDGHTSLPGYNGPSDYGFTNKCTVPTRSYPGDLNGTGASSEYPSPDGILNNGAAGDFLDTSNAPLTHSNAPQFYSGYVVPPAPVIYPGLTLPSYVQLSDNAILEAFQNWASPPSGWPTVPPPPQEPWFCGLSFVNPHDISHFPYAFGLCPTSMGACATPSGDFGCPNVPASADSDAMYKPPIGFQPPPQVGFNFGTTEEGEIQAAPGCSVSLSGCGPGAPVAVYSTSSLLPPNCVASGSPNDNVNSIPYLSFGTSGAPGGKPGLQAYFQYVSDSETGSILNPTGAGWVTFLNYYYWMQSCADWAVGQALKSIPASADGRPTLIVFTSDHGDYAGSHWLHKKGGALYDECLNVPFYVTMLTQTADGEGGYTQTYTPSTYTPMPYVCSSVDVLPFLYSMALGNETWRGCNSSNSDMVWYLAGRESIRDAIYSGSLAEQVRVVDITYPAGTIPGGTNGKKVSLPYVLHTTDEFKAASYVPAAALGAEAPPAEGGHSQPSHAVCIRTVDTSLSTSLFPPPPTPFKNPNYTYYGGGKLGIYTYWATAANCLDGGHYSAVWPNPSKQPSGSPTKFQFEFYNYYNGNFAELKNDAFPGGGPWDTSYAQPYLDAFNSSVVRDELYSIPTQSVCTQTDLTNAYTNAFNSYVANIGESSCSSSTPPIYNPTAGTVPPTIKAPS